MIFKVFYLFVSLFLMCSFTNCNISATSNGGVSVDNKIISDASSVDDDLTNLGLIPSDYIDIRTKVDDDYEYYNNDYIIAMAENKNVDKICVYIYIYNPVKVLSDCNFKLGSFALNGKSQDAYLYANPQSNCNNTMGFKVGESNVGFNIMKYKLMINSIENNRKYSIDSLTNLTNNRLNNVPFEASFYDVVNDKTITRFSFNSFIFITDDLVQPVLVHDLAGFSNSFMNLINLLIGNNPWKRSTLFFYNFNSNKKIDKILDCDVEYNLVKTCTTIYKKFPNDIEREKIVKELQTSHKNFTIYSNQNSNLQIYGEIKSFTAFNSGKQRIEEFGANLAFGEDIKSCFEKYEHSVFLGVEEYIRTEDKDEYAKYPYEENTFEYSIKNFKLTRMRFETDGFIYNSYVADMPNDSVDPIIPDTPKSPLERFIERLLEWIKAHPFEAFMIALSLVVLMPVIISLLPLIIHSIVAVGCVIFKSLLLVIKLPFKLLIAFFKPPKKKGYELMKNKEKYVGKIAHVDNKVLGFRANTRGHYVFVRKDNGDTVDVNVITSLEDKDGHYPENKFHNVVNGNTIPLPKKGKKSFKLWSGVSTTKITNIPKDNLRIDESYEISNKYKIVIGILCNKKKRGK